MNRVYKHEHIYIQQQLLKERGAVVSAGPSLSPITGRLGCKGFFIIKDAGAFSGNGQACVFSVTKWLKKHIHILCTMEGCCRPAQFTTAVCDTSYIVLSKVQNS